MRLITDEQHAQIVEALKRVSDVDNDCDILSPNLAYAVTEAIDVLQALPEMEHVGWYDTFDNADLTYSVGELMGGNTDGLKPLYATKEPS